MRRAVLAASMLLLAACATVAPAVQFQPGDWVLAYWQDDRVFVYPAVVTARTGNDVALQYDDGDVGVQHADNMRRFDCTSGTVLECRWSDGVWYPARIAQMSEDRYNIQVLFDDGDKLATNTSQCRGH